MSNNTFTESDIKQKVITLRQKGELHPLIGGKIKNFF